jgi:DNA-binding response OmpR family regulator
MSAKILVVEDDRALLETLTYNLRKEGYLVTTASDGLVALQLAQQQSPDLVILDIMLPGLDGFEFTRRLRQQSTVPILMLTARDDEIDRVVGLEVGGDDYLTKPFSMRELMARVKAQLRRVNMTKGLPPAEARAEEQPSLTFGNLTLHRSRGEVLLNGTPLTLKPKEYELLLYFAEHPRRLLSRERILEDVWGWEYTGDSRTVDVHVRWLRQKIEPDPSRPERIITVRGGGYRFEG